MSTAGTYSALQKRPTLGQMVSNSTMLLMILIGVLIFLLAFVNLFHKNANATKGYVLRQLEKNRVELQIDQQYINTRISEAQSLQTLELDPSIQSMVAITRPLYIQGDSTVAEDPR